MKFECGVEVEHGRVLTLFAVVDNCYFRIVVIMCYVERGILNLGSGTLFRQRLASACDGIVKWREGGSGLGSFWRVWEVFSFMRGSKMLLGKMVWSSLRWLPAACSMCIWNLSAIP